MLSEKDINTLESILFADPWAEDAMDFFGLHGAISAAVVGPTEPDTKTLFALATGQENTDAGEVPEAFSQATANLIKAMRNALDLGQDIELPEPEDGDPQNALENWCAGFIDAFLLNEDDWLAREEETVAGLLVPMMALSGLFEDEDFVKAREDSRVSAQLADAIPDSLTDLYLLFHAPD